MAKSSTIRSVETLSCDAGWRNYHFVKVMTEDGLIGWSEFDEGFGAPGVGTAIERLSTRIIGKNALQHERIYAELFSATRPAAGGVVALALGAIENALLDVKAKALGVPATSCSAARSATVSGSTGRIAPPGASTIPIGTSRPLSISMASRRSAARCAKSASPR
jgi:L-alanine-DL-glutamate epimerase-like enolase superfamily enzyme